MFALGRVRLLLVQWMGLVARRHKGTVYRYRAANHHDDAQRRRAFRRLADWAKLRASHNHAVLKGCVFWSKWRLTTCVCLRWPDYAAACINRRHRISQAYGEYDKECLLVGCRSWLMAVLDCDAGSISMPTTKLALDDVDGFGDGENRSMNTVVRKYGLHWLRVTRLRQLKRLQQHQVPTTALLNTAALGGNQYTELLQYRQHHRMGVDMIVSQSPMVISAKEHKKQQRLQQRREEDEAAACVSNFMVPKPLPQWDPYLAMSSLSPAEALLHSTSSVGCVGVATGLDRQPVRPLPLRVPIALSNSSSAEGDARHTSTSVADMNVDDSSDKDVKDKIRECLAYMQMEADQHGFMARVGASGSDGWRASFPELLQKVYMAAESPLTPPQRAVLLQECQALVDILQAR